MYLNAKLFGLICFLFCFGFNQATAQNPGELFGQARLAQDKGNFILSERLLLLILKQKESIKNENLVAVYNQLGLINKALGELDKALNYYLQGSTISMENLSYMQYKLPSLYNNIGDIFKDKGDYVKALEYFQESINNLNAKGLTSIEKNTSKAKTFNSIGLVYFQQKKYSQAVEYFKKSIALRKQYKLKGLDILYSNYANCLRDLNNMKLAETYYQKCIDFRIVNFGKDYYRLSSVYTSQGKLKQKEKAYEEALGLYEKALKISQKNYGAKHPYVAEIFEIIGDYYTEQKKYEIALRYYQKSLIANVTDFNSTDLNDNPKLNNILSEVQILKSLEKKTRTLMIVYENKKDKARKNQSAALCIQTAELATEIIQNLRKEYISDESKLYITNNEKTFYILGVENASRLYTLTREKHYIEKAYQYARACKAAVLEDEIKSDEVLKNLLPESTYVQKNDLQQEIAAHKKLIFDEQERSESDQSKIALWQTELFKISREYENLLKNISYNYPHYAELISNQKQVELSSIQKKLMHNEILIEYSYLLNSTDKQLFAFVISKNGIKYNHFTIDSSFEQNIEYCHNKMNQSGNSSITIGEYNNTNKRLYKLYEQLIAPLEIPLGKNIIIVPDEKIAYISFDELISEYKKEAEVNYSNLPYLVYQYRFSYAYSASLYLRQRNRAKYSNNLYAFAPEYGSISENSSRGQFGELKNTKKELSSISKTFHGTSFIGNEATKANFKSALKNKGIYHLAMHASADKEKPEYSYLVFSSPSENNQSAFLYNYEIASIPMNASMLVLSACNTGDGDIYRGEGVMSLSRWFMLAGIQSVVHGLWKINDEASVFIMEIFYKYLAMGKSKTEALQLAKIEYINNAPPELANPKYWAGMVIMGNQEPLVKNQNWLLSLLIGVLLLLATGIGFKFYKQKQVN